MSVKGAIKGVLKDFGKDIKKQAKKELAKAGKSGRLSNSIDYEVDGGKKKFKLTITTDSYGAFVDQGVRGKESASRAPKSPFKFGSGKGKKGGLQKGIKKWIKRKGIEFKDRKTGKTLSRKATTWLIARSVYSKGIRPTYFLTKPFDKKFKKLPQEILDAYLPEVLEEVIKKIRKQK